MYGYLRLEEPYHLLATSITYIVHNLCGLLSAGCFYHFLPSLAGSRRSPAGHGRPRTCIFASDSMARGRTDPLPGVIPLVREFLHPVARGGQRCCPRASELRRARPRVLRRGSSSPSLPSFADVAIADCVAEVADVLRPWTSPVAMAASAPSCKTLAVDRSTDPIRRWIVHVTGPPSVLLSA